MLNARHLATLKQLLSLPTAPFAERHVIAAILRYCRSRTAVKASRDTAGNILVHYRSGKRDVSRPICLTAHMDHPGFIVEERLDKHTIRTTWRGGVKPEYFVGARVRFYDETARNGRLRGAGLSGQWVRGKIESIATATLSGIDRVQTADVALKPDLRSGTIGMWDFPDPVVRGQRIYARGCDDIAGCAALLCCLDGLVRRKIETEAYCLFTRAEEVGFVGAIAACREMTIPDHCLVVSMETSAQLPHAPMGAGPILRVGDKATTFTPAATAHVRRVADKLAAADKSFKYQRRLMDGGTCESSVFCEFGYTATGTCVALGNYHNMDTQRGRVGAEFIDLSDFELMIRWFVELCRASDPFDGTDPVLRANFERLEESHADLLARSRHGDVTGARPIRSNLL